MDKALIDALKKENIYIAVETNGTLEAPDGIDWICMSPKANTRIKLTKGSEVKVVYPQADLNPDNFKSLNFKNFYIQPMDSLDYEKNVSQSVKYCMQNPNWKLSLQTHKILGIR